MSVSKEVAQQHLDAWLKAELAISNAQSYTINSRNLTRANLSEVRKQIDYWRKEVQRLSGKRKMVKRCVIRDL